MRSGEPNGNYKTQVPEGESSRHTPLGGASLQGRMQGFGRLKARVDPHCALGGCNEQSVAVRNSRPARYLHVTQCLFTLRSSSVNWHVAASTASGRHTRKPSLVPTTRRFRQRGTGRHLSSFRKARSSRIAAGCAERFTRKSRIQQRVDSRRTRDEGAEDLFCVGPVQRGALNNECLVCWTT